MSTNLWEVFAGDIVEVRSKEEILATLDRDGRLEGLPFMPQMFEYCGRKLKVVARAHKTCDVVGGKGRRIKDAIHLDTRCDGRAYGGCQVACLLFWKLAWVRPVLPLGKEVLGEEQLPVAVCTEADVQRATRKPGHSVDEEIVYTCQATTIPDFTRPLAWWDARQYVEDYQSRNASLARLARGLAYQLFDHGTQAWRHRIGRPARATYDAFQRVVGGIPYPRKPGRLPMGSPAPTYDLNLQPGDLVRVKSQQEILATITKGGTNRGLLFDKEMVPFCGKVFRVKTRVTTFVHEKTGRLTGLKTPAVILENVWCQSRYSNNKMYCPRSLYIWWREVWLERVAPDVRGANVLASGPQSQGQRCP